MKRSNYRLLHGYHCFSHSKMWSVFNGLESNYLLFKGTLTHTTIQKKCHRFLLLFNYGRCMQGSIHSFFLMCDMLHTLSSMFASMESKCLLPTVQHLVCICISVLSRRMWPLRSSGIIPSKLTRQERLQCKHCQHSVTSFPDW